MSDIDALRDRLIAERKAAQTVVEVCAAVARVEHYNRAYAAGHRTVAALTCPDKIIPEPVDLAAGLPECRALERMAAADAMDAVARTLATHDAPSRRVATALASVDPAKLAENVSDADLDRLIATVNDMALPGMAPITAADLSDADRATLVQGSALLGAMFATWSTPAGEAAAIAHLFRRWLSDPEVESDGKTLLGAKRVHRAWRAACKHADCLRHPFAPLVEAWQQRPPPAEWDSREHPVLSGTLAGRDGGLRPLVMANDPRQLPLSLTGGSEPRQLWLGFEQPEPDRVPVLPLVAFDRRGGVSMTSGAGAAHAIRLYVEALLAVPPDRRNDGLPIPLRAKLREVVEGLWPRGWQRGRDWPRLLAGLDELRRLGVEWEHGGTGGVWFAVTVRSVPREDARLDDLVQFEVQLPPGSGPGPMVARRHLRLLGLDSAPAYRLYLSLCWLWDHYGTVRGRLIGTAPPLRRGKPVKPAEVGGYLVNPAALHRYPALSPDHLAVMSYAPADLAQEGSSTRRTQRQRAREALARIAAQTGAVVVPSPGAAPGSVQVFPPTNHKAAHDGKAELWRHLNRDG